MSTTEADLKSMPISMTAVAVLHRVLDLPRISSLPGCWEYQLDRDWWFAVNGLRYHAPCSRDAVLAPKSLYVTWRQFPVGIVTHSRAQWIDRPGRHEIDFAGRVVDEIKKLDQESAEQTEIVIDILLGVDSGA